ncbi:hypothetical protein [Vibrio porteresiae]|uniref:Uncharacterized protein n=1 Tax=Vibrio porteresiae DSM 19223 TaxID=1123496 RepID=A0ABZ0QM54_9VIBR|nr:hypothetical protein [Vibrio porteresiae]WPC76875.1 hypothetical protein R8Z52_20325 [Vibrio porteresiae DSM 19223]
MFIDISKNVPEHITQVMTSMPSVLLLLYTCKAEVNHSNTNLKDHQLSHSRLGSRNIQLAQFATLRCESQSNLF